MRLGLISDVHGNLVALDAVIADGRDVGVTAWWVLGDLAAIGPEPSATLERLTNLPEVRFVRGNTDRYVVTGERPRPHVADVEADESLRPLFDAVEASFSWTRAAIGDAWVAFLGDLRSEQRLVLRDGTRLHGVHASVSSDDGPGITPDIPDDELRGLLAGSDCDVICGGHTHQPTDRRVGRLRAVNLGSVSNPMTFDLRATYVVIDDDPGGHVLVHRRVAYDHDTVVRAIRRSGHPEADHLMSFQRGEQSKYAAERPGTPTFVGSHPITR